jgi:succinyl-CoA synthetase alpha subunit
MLYGFYWNADRNDRPIMGLVAGFQAVKGRVMGHSGAIALSGQTAEIKSSILQDAGVVMVDHPAMFGEGMRTLLDVPHRTGSKVSPT